jgi:hypothetical protein
MYDGLATCWQITGQGLLVFSVLLLTAALVALILQGDNAAARYFFLKMRAASRMPQRIPAQAR